MEKQRESSTNKIFRTLDEQIEILKSKGLIIDDEYNAKTILLRENYFFLAGLLLFLASTFAGISGSFERYV